MTAIIVAHSANHVIGNNNTLPWHLPADLKHFKELTTGKPVIMGRKTYESIIARLGKPLPNRQNIVVSKTLGANTDIIVANSLEAALESTKNHQDAFIIGGAQLYRTALEQGCVDRMYVTKINASTSGDTFFPEYNAADWLVIAQEPHHYQDYSYEFITYQKKVNR